ncbi:MAG: acyl-CoA dehydrogenase family protein [Polyangiales bacterium]
MDFTLTADQTTLATALEGLIAPFKDMPVNFRGFALASDSLEAQLAEAEFFDIATTEGLGPVSAALTVERLARLPFACEAALSMLVRPFLPGGPWERPIAVVEQGRPGRFVAQAKTLVLVDGEKVSVARVTPEDVESVESIYAYPMGRLKKEVRGEALSSSEAVRVRRWLRVAMAAEAAGLMQAALDSTVDHLRVRKQFGRPLGSFQALRHRMAECAVLTGGARWLALKAASTESEADAALAAFQAQESATRLTYELHQMLGAMGMTLEHPLHLWTYRLKALLGELGGRAGNAREVARHAFSA